MSSDFIPKTLWEIFPGELVLIPRRESSLGELEWSDKGKRELLFYYMKHQ